jgi:homopolymeric O-antigen transport system permease protein
MDHHTITADSQITAIGGHRDVAVYANNKQVPRAFADLVGGLRSWPLWASLAAQDIRLRYTRSVIGPFWLTLSMATMVLGLGFMYAGLFGIATREYIPYVATGLVIWGFISTCLMDGCVAFSSAAAAIKQFPTPLSIYAYRVVWRNFLVLMHNMIIYVGIALLFGIWVGLGNILLAALGIVVLCLNAIWTSLFLGVVSARFRDVPPIVTSFIQVAFFLTPVFWRADQLPERASFVKYNPFLYYVEIVRAPLLGGASQLDNWIVVLSLTCIGCLVSFLTFIRFRRRLSYWA